MSDFVPITDASPFRRMAAAMWSNPRDPSIYGTMDVDAAPALAFLDAQRARTDAKLTVTHLVARAVALALRDQPEINAKVRFWGKLEQRTSIDLFLTVATDGGKDLSGVRIDRADQRSLLEIAGELGKRARDIRSGADRSYTKSKAGFAKLPWWLTRAAVRAGDVAVNELHLDLPGLGLPRDAFGSAMITSVGMFGIDTAFAPFVPMARVPMLLLVPEVRPRPVVVGGDRLEVRPVMRLCATFDHRIVDGFAAGKLARRLHALFAQPDLLA
jgi:pyruvate/2-oxoglutarate dehydrogenase complex dihydrolipoamide acyltransferase (E2) component